MPDERVAAFKIFEDMLIQIKEIKALHLQHNNLLQQLLQQRKCMSPQNEEKLLSELKRREILTTKNVMHILSCSTATALRIMQRLGEEGKAKYVRGSGNISSKLVSLTQKPKVLNEYGEAIHA
jgi:Fic family protein